MITKINDTAVKDAADLRNEVGLLRPGESIELMLIRDGEQKTIDTVIKAKQAQ